MNQTQRENHSTQVAVWLVVTVLFTIVVAIALVSLTYHQMVLDGQWAMSSEWLRKTDIESRSATLGQLGDYFGGTLNPILSFSGFLVLLLTVVLQRRQLMEGTRQIEQSTRAIDLEAFVRVNDILQTADGIAARERLYELFQDGPEKKPFAQWRRSDERVVESVGRQFELVGQLIEGKLFDPNLFLRSWCRTIEKCWVACEAMVIDRRTRQNDPGFWRHFEELNALAKVCRPTIATRLGYESVGANASGSGPTPDQTIVKPSEHIRQTARLK